MLALDAMNFTRRIWLAVVSNILIEQCVCSNWLMMNLQQFDTGITARHTIMLIL
jgi:hypothetical protein